MSEGSPNAERAKVKRGFDDFRNMPIEELKAHEKGIMNLIEKSFSEENQYLPMSIS
jgi:hypothetical protein